MNKQQIIDYNLKNFFVYLQNQMINKYKLSFEN